MARIRTCVLAAGAAAFLSAQSVYAAPPPPQATGTDPLVSLSALSTPQPAVPILAAAAAVQTDDGTPKPINPLFIGLIGLVLVAVIVALVSGGGHAHGDLTPVSPA